MKTGLNNNVAKNIGQSLAKMGDDLNRKYTGSSLSRGGTKTTSSSSGIRSGGGGLSSTSYL